MIYSRVSPNLCFPSNSFGGEWLIRDSCTSSATFYIESSSIHCKGKSSVSVSVASNATVNLLVDFDRADILNMKEDGRRLERMVFFLRYLFIS